MGKLMGGYNPKQPWTTGVFTWNSYVAFKGIFCDDGKLLYIPYKNNTASKNLNTSDT